MIGRRLAAWGILALVSPAVLHAQAGLASSATGIALIARVAPRASISGPGPTRETARLDSLKEKTVKVRLSANTAYRRVVVGTAPVTSPAETASRLWVRVETERFEEVKSGAAVTVVRGHHAVRDREPELKFRTERPNRPTDRRYFRYAVR